MKTMTTLFGIVLAFVIGISLTTAQGISPFTEIGNLEMQVLDALNMIVEDLNAEIIRIDSLNATEISEQAEQDGMQIDIAQLLLDVAVMEKLHASSDNQILVSCWSADGDATDSVGSNDGTLVGTVTFPAGQVGQAFDTSNGYISMGAPEDLNTINGVTIVAWINQESTVDSPYVISKWPGNAFEQDYQWTVRKIDITSSVYRADYGFISSTPVHIGSFSINTWNHVATSYDGINGKIKNVVNGIEGVENIIRPDVKMNNSTGVELFIGTDRSTGGDTFQGLIDEVAIFNYAVPAQKIIDAFNAGGSCSDYANIT